MDSYLAGIRAAFLVLSISGILGVLLDLDHLISYLVRGTADRSAHPGSVLVSGGVFVLSCALSIGLSIIERRKK